MDTKTRKEYEIQLPTGEKIVGHYYSYKQALAHGHNICIKRYLNINKLIVKVK